MTDPAAPTTEAGRRMTLYADNVQRAIHPMPRQPTEPHVCKEPEACDLILEVKQHVLAIEAEARSTSAEALTELLDIYDELDPFVTLSTDEARQAYERWLDAMLAARLRSPESDR